MWDVASDTKSPEYNLDNLACWGESNDNTILIGYISGLSKRI